MSDQSPSTADRTATDAGQSGVGPAKSGAAKPGPSKPGHFADRLVSALRQLGHPLCLGLDPHLGRLPPLFARGSMQPGDPATAEVVGDFLVAILERAAGRVAVVKPQAAFFEALGWPGLRTLEAVIAKARQLGFVVLLDAKRGDIGSSAAAYASAYLAPDAPCTVDALTVNPYLGPETLEPFLTHADEDKGVFALVKTSNPGSGDLQDRKLLAESESASNPTVFEAVAHLLAQRCQELTGPQTGWSSLGVVVGATYPGPAERVREILPRALFLVPGYGAQGGSAAAAVRAFQPGPKGLEGGIVNSSRGLLFPAGAHTDEVSAWEQAIDQALQHAIEELGAAVAR